MTRPTRTQISAAARVLAREWDADGAKAGGCTAAYEEWGAGIADMILHAPLPETLVEYLGVLDEQLGLESSSHAQRVEWAAELEAAVRANRPSSR